MSYCAECVEKAKARNRDMEGMIKKAKQQAIEDQQPKAVCWNIKEGLYIEDAFTAAKEGYIIRHVLSEL